MLNRLQAVEDKYRELESLISDPEVICDMAKWQRYNKEHSQLEPIVEKFREYQRICREIEEDKELFDEPIESELLTDFPVPAPLQRPPPQLIPVVSHQQSSF